MATAMPANGSSALGNREAASVFVNQMYASDGLITYKVGYSNNYYDVETVSNWAGVNCGEGTGRVMTGTIGAQGGGSGAGMPRDLLINGISYDSPTDATFISGENPVVIVQSAGLVVSYLVSCPLPIEDSGE